MLDNGAPISGIGCQGHFGPKSIDLNKVEDSLDKLWKRFGIPIWITEFDWANSDSNANNHEQHATELENFYKLIFRYSNKYFEIPFLEIHVYHFYGQLSGYFK